MGKVMLSVVVAEILDPRRQLVLLRRVLVEPEWSNEAIFGQKFLHRPRVCSGCALERPKEVAGYPVRPLEVVLS